MNNQQLDNLQQPPVSVVRLGVGEAHPAEIETWLLDGEWSGRLTFMIPEQPVPAFALHFAGRGQDSVISQLNSVYETVVRFMETYYVLRLGSILRWLGTRQDITRREPNPISKQVNVRPDGDTWLGEMQLQSLMMPDDKLKLQLGRFKSRDEANAYGKQLHEQIVAYMDDRYKDRVARLFRYLSEA